MLLSPLNPIDIYKLRNALEAVKSLCPFAKGEGSKEAQVAQAIVTTSKLFLVDFGPSICLLPCPSRT
jgi:hypothetical protein